MGNEKFILCSSSGTKQIEASSWNVIKQASPSTVFQNPATLLAFSDTNNAYEGVANSTKTIIYFAAAIPAGVLLFMPWATDFALLNTIQYHKTFGSGASFSPGLTAAFSVRIRPVIAAIPVASNILAWNNFAGFTFDTERTLGQATQDAFNLTTGAAGVTTDSGVLNVRLPLPPIQLTTTVPLFGIVIDTKINVSSTQWVIDSQGSSLSAPVPSGGTNRHIYGIKMQP